MSHDKEEFTIQQCLGDPLYGRIRKALYSTTTSGSEDVNITELQQVARIHPVESLDCATNGELLLCVNKLKVIVLLISKLRHGLYPTLHLYFLQEHASDLLPLLDCYIEPIKNHKDQLLYLSLDFCTYKSGYHFSRSKIIHNVLCH
jgi:hypothetical protein